MVPKILYFVFLFLFIVLVSPQIGTKALADCTTITGAPNLYQIDRGSSKATLFFTPVNNGVSKYVITYGTAIGAEQNSVMFSYGTSTGAVSYTVNDLDPSLKYYFKVRATSDCSSGPWSAWVGDNITPTPTSQAKSVATIVAGANDVRNIALISIPMIVVGLFLLTSPRKQSA